MGCMDVACIYWFVTIFSILFLLSPFTSSSLPSLPHPTRRPKPMVDDTSACAGNRDTMSWTTICALSGAANSCYAVFARVPV
ncbi:hypothetical protein DFS33DRAFT_1307319, partial [Desarmillaria ectypa]